MLTVVTPSLTAGPQRITITNPDGEAIALEAALTVLSDFRVLSPDTRLTFFCPVHPMLRMQDWN
jgi:hypothetical protein